MQYVLILHEVASYPAWKAVFDGATDLRRRAGELSYQLLREAGNDGNVVHLSRWSSLEAARAFFESGELIELRRRAGVRAPQFVYLREVERGDL